jgi:Prenyltransferase and squalene oxidase repeat
VRPLSPSRKPQAITNSEVKRRFWCTSRTRCAHPLNSERHPDPSDARSPHAPRRTAGDRLYALLPSPPPSFLFKGAITNTDIFGLQQPSGVFAGDAFGETDTRFLYCAVSALSLLGALDRLDRDRTVSYLASCRNFDGGFGRIAGAESHAAQGTCESPHLLPPLP